MAHLAEHAAIRARDALDGVDGAVRVPRQGQRRLSLLVDVLRGDLAALAQLRHHLRRGGKSALAMGDSNRVHVADLYVVEPRREIRSHLRAHHAGDVAAQRIVRKRRRFLREIADLAVGHEAELDERLKTVADAEHEAVAALQQAHDLLRDTRIAEHGRDELAGAVRLVTAGETAREHDDVGGADAFDDGLHRLLDSLRREVAHDQRLRLGACALPGPRRIILAVRAGKYGDEYARLRHGRYAASQVVALRVGTPAHALARTEWPRE